MLLTAVSDAPAARRLPGALERLELAGGRGSGLRQAVATLVIAGSPGRRRARAARAPMKRVNDGMRLPGLRCWLRRDPAGERAALMSAARPAATRRRPPTCVRSGPSVARRGRAAHGVAGAAVRDEQRSRRARAGRSAAGAGAACCAASHARTRRRGTHHVERHPRVLRCRSTRRTGREARRACAPEPQRMCGPGPYRPCRASPGTQKLWITSAVLTCSSTGPPTGTCSSLAVASVARPAASR